MSQQILNHARMDALYLPHEGNIQEISFQVASEFHLDIGGGTVLPAGFTTLPDAGDFLVWVSILR